MRWATALLGVATLEAQRLDESDDLREEPTDDEYAIPLQLLSTSHAPGVVHC